MPDENQKAQKVDINDLNLASEEQELNPDADAYAAPPPPPDQRWQAKLAISEQGITAGKVKKGAQQGKGFYQINLAATLTAPDSPFDGRVIFDGPTTLVFDGISKAAGLTKILGGVVAARTTNVEVARELARIVQGQPTVLLDSRWEGYCRDCEKTVLKGMKRFPQNADGTHAHTVKCPHCGGEVSAKATVAKYAKFDPDAVAAATA